MISGCLIGFIYIYIYSVFQYLIKVSNLQYLSSFQLYYNLGPADPSLNTEFQAGGQYTIRKVFVCTVSGLLEEAEEPKYT